MPPKADWLALIDAHLADPDDRGARDALWVAVYPRLLDICRRHAYTIPTDAVGLASEVLLCLKPAPLRRFRAKNRDNFLAWLSVFARFRASSLRAQEITRPSDGRGGRDPNIRINYVDPRGQDKHVTGPLPAVDYWNATELPDIERRMAADLLHAAIDGLPDRQRQLVLLRLRGMTAPEIVTATGLKRPAVDSGIREGLRALALKLAGGWADPLDAERSAAREALVRGQKERDYARKRQHKRAVRASRPKPEPVTFRLFCDTCGHPFESIYPNAKTCGDECARVRNRARARERQRQYRDRKRALATATA